MIFFSFAQLYFYVIKHEYAAYRYLPVHHVPMNQMAFVMGRALK